MVYNNIVNIQKTNEIHIVFSIQCSQSCCIFFSTSDTIFWFELSILIHVKYILKVDGAMVNTTLIGETFVT